METRVYKVKIGKATQNGYGFLKYLKEKVSKIILLSNSPIRHLKVIVKQVMSLYLLDEELDEEFFLCFLHQDLFHTCTSMRMMQVTRIEQDL